MKIEFFQSVRCKAFSARYNALCAAFLRWLRRLLGVLVRGLCGVCERFAAQRGLNGRVKHFVLCQLSVPRLILAARTERAIQRKVPRAEDAADCCAGCKFLG